jgi:hypothetical protein
MPLPTSYSESTLAEYMRTGVLRSTGLVLGLVAADYQEAVNEVAAALGTTIEAAPDVSRMRILARREAWRLAMQQSGGDYAYSEDGISNNRQQIFDHAKEMFSQAERDLASFDAGTPSGGDGDTDPNTTSSRVSFAVPNKAVW